MATLRVYVDKILDVADYKFDGELVYSALRDAINQYYGGAPTKYTVWDFTNTDVSKFRNSELMQIGNQVGLAGKARDNCYDVIIVPGLIHYGLARVYASYAEIIQKRNNALKTMVFRSREHALDWIKANEKFSKSNNKD